VNLGAAFRGRVWRILSPRWAHSPLSGDGAARNGGRWNRPGQPALYMSEQIETAFAEYQQELGVRPGTFVAHDVEATLVDLTRPDVLEAVGAAKAELLSPWKSVAWVEGRTPATWRLADRLSGEHCGVRVPSAQYASGANLVLWTWNMPGGARVSVLDPRRELPG
jgi:RES domain-containing protein